MFIAFRGRGFLVGVIAAGCLVGSDYAAGRYYRDSNYYADHGWPKLAAFWAAALIIWWMLPGKKEEVLGVALQAEEPGSIFRSRDTLFWIPAKYWPGILFALGIVFYFVRE